MTLIFLKGIGLMTVEWLCQCEIINYININISMTNKKPIYTYLKDYHFISFFYKAFIFYVSFY